MKMDSKDAPKDFLLKELAKAHDDFDVFGVDVLVAIYRRPEKTEGGILLPDAVKGEDIYQGKVGLVLKVGPMVNERNKELDSWFKGEIPAVGDWVVVRVGDTFAFNLNKVPCRLVEAKQLRGRVASPDLVW